MYNSLIIGATIDCFIYSRIERKYVSANRYFPQKKDLAFSRDMYSKSDVLRVMTRPMRYSNDFANEFTERTFKTIEETQDKVNKARRQEGDLQIILDDQVLFDPNELAEDYIPCGPAHLKTDWRPAHFHLHFSDLNENIKSSKVCAMLDSLLKPYQELEPDRMRRKYFGSPIRNFVDKQYNYEGGECQGFEYRTFSPIIIKTCLFPFMKDVQIALKNYINESRNKIKV
jgi:hypothetical protein